VSDTFPLRDLVERLPRARVVLLGDLVLDRFILGTPKRISREAPVIILRFEGQRDIPGGGANALANLAALGVQALPVGAVGDDEAGQALVVALRQLGVDTAGVVRVPGYRTPVKVRILGGGASSLKHQVARYDVEDELPAAGPWRDELLDKLRNAAHMADAVAVSDYGYGAVDAGCLSEILASGRRPRWVCLDSRHRLTELPGVDGATPNLQELEACAGRPLHTDGEVADAAAALCSHLGARFVLATRGHRGMTLAERGLAPVHIPVYGTDQVADVTGAGDTVLAVLTAALAVGASPASAARLANLAGGIVVMKLGTATVGRDELARAAAQPTAAGGRP
jgi:rfaE bifunctional protein kinase chain/domain